MGSWIEIWVQNRSRTQSTQEAHRISINRVPGTVPALKSRVFELYFFPWNLRSTYIFSLQKYFLRVRGATGRIKIKFFYPEILTRIDARDRCLDCRTRAFQASRTPPSKYFWRRVNLELIGAVHGRSDLDLVSRIAGSDFRKMIYWTIVYVWNTTECGRNHLFSSESHTNWI